MRGIRTQTCKPVRPDRIVQPDILVYEYRPLSQRLIMLCNVLEKDAGLSDSILASKESHVAIALIMMVYYRAERRQQTWKGSQKPTESAVGGADDELSLHSVKGNTSVL